MSRPSVNRGFTDSPLAAVLVMSVALAFAIGLASDVRGALIGEYDLTTGTFANAVVGSPISGNMTSEVSPGGSAGFDVGGWTWSGATTPGSGLLLEGLPATGNGTFSQYTIAVEFAFGQVTDWRRLMWLDPADERGLFVRNGGFELLGSGNATSGSITANSTASVVVTRAGDGTVTAYQVINPESPTPTVNELVTFVDNDDIMVSPLGTMEFFRDNDAIPEFSDSGTVSLIKIWDAPLTPAEVTFAFVPEPATIALLAVAGGGGMLLHRRRRRLR